MSPTVTLRNVSFSLQCWPFLLHIFSWLVIRCLNIVIFKFSCHIYIVLINFIVVQSLRDVWLWPHGLASLSFTISWSLLKLMSIESMMPSNHLILCCPLLLLPSIFLIKAICPVNQLFTSGSQSIGALASVLPRNIQGWFPLGLTGLISLLSKGLSGVFSSTPFRKHQFFST